jgi:hypothetical protein
MVVFRPLALFLALAFLLPGTVLAKGKRKPQPPPAPAPVAIPQAPQPSAMLQAYSENNLEHLLGPLNNGALPRAELMRMATDFKAHQLLGIPEEKAMWQAAINVCVAFDRIMDEREKTVMGMQQGRSPMTSGALGANRTVRLNDWRDELQAHREAQDTKARKQQTRAADAFVVSSGESAANTMWRQRVQPWRLQVQQLLVAERQAELATPAP